MHAVPGYPHILMPDGLCSYNREATGHQVNVPRDPRTPCPASCLGPGPNGFTAFLAISTLRTRLSGGCFADYKEKAIWRAASPMSSLLVRVSTGIASTSRDVRQLPLYSETLSICDVSFSYTLLPEISSGSRHCPVLIRARTDSTQSHLL